MLGKITLISIHTLSLTKPCACYNYSLPAFMLALIGYYTFKIVLKTITFVTLKENI